MLDVARWLAEQGLGHHAEAFAENGIAGDVLRDLTDADLKELGLNLGDRKRLLKAIAALDAGPALDRAEPAEQTTTPAIPRKAERRQLTVMFVDLVGSTALSATLDPEDLREVIRAYHRCVAAVVERFEGHVAKYLGDGILAYLGWPQAHEDDAERAVRAGLAIVGAVPALAPLPDVQLQARVGIATGIAVVGDLIGEGASREEAVVGDVPNLAGRLQALAEPGSVVIGKVTRKLIGALFDLDDLGPTHLKGFAEPLAVWRVAGERRAEGRFEASHTTGLTPLVGREEEIALLLRRWQQAEEGEGQVVLLSGEPGIGKSRLVQELRGRLGDEPHLRLTYQCSPHHQTSPLYPVIEQLERAAGFERNDPAAERLDKLEALLARGTKKLDQAVPLIAALLGVPAGERHRLPELSPQRQKQLTLEALVDQLEGLAAKQPVLLAYEDVHWIDPTTQELLGLASASSAAGARDHHLPARVSAALDRSSAPQRAAPDPTRPARECRHGRGDGRRQGPSGGGQRTDPGQDRRRAAVRRGADQGRPGVRASGGPRAAGGPGDAARYADGAARPDGRDEGRGADRRGARAGLQRGPAGGGLPAGGRSTGCGPRRARPGGAAVPQGQATPCRVCLQARPRP
jgi:class 3 adenylate cyclase